MTPDPIQPIASRRRFVPAATLFVLLVTLIGASIPFWRHQRPVAIPDPVLEAALHEVLNIPATSSLPQGRLEGVTYLDISHKQTITDLTGLEAMTALQVLRVSLASPESEPVKSQIEALRDRGVKVEVKMP